MLSGLHCGRVLPPVLAWSPPLIQLAGDKETRAGLSYYWQAMGEYRTRLFLLFIAKRKQSKLLFIQMTCDFSRFQTLSSSTPSTLTSTTPRKRTSSSGSWTMERFSGASGLPSHFYRHVKSFFLLKHASFKDDHQGQLPNGPSILPLRPSIVLPWVRELWVDFAIHTCKTII